MQAWEITGEGITQAGKPRTPAQQQIAQLQIQAKQAQQRVKKAKAQQTLLKAKQQMSDALKP